MEHVVTQRRRRVPGAEQTVEPETGPVNCTVDGDSSHHARLGTIQAQRTSRGVRFAGSARWQPGLDLEV